MKRMTRGLKSQAQKLLDVNTAMKILEQKSQPLIVDHNKLKVESLLEAYYGFPTISTVNESEVLVGGIDLRMLF